MVVARTSGRATGQWHLQELGCGPRRRPHFEQHIVTDSVTNVLVCSWSQVPTYPWMRGSGHFEDLPLSPVFYLSTANFDCHAISRDHLRIQVQCPFALCERASASLQPKSLPSISCHERESIGPRTRERPKLGGKRSCDSYCGGYTSLSGVRKSALAIYASTIRQAPHGESGLTHLLARSPVS